MTGSQIAEDAERLYKILNEEDIGKKILLSGFVEYSDATKHAVVQRLLRTYDPAPSGKLLARLLYIRTSENEAGMRTLFLANLRSPQPDARRITLFGLKELKHPALLDLALLSMRDDADQVLAVALEILLPETKSNADLRAYLQGFYAAHQGKGEFHMSCSLLEAHGIVSTSPGDK
jgi:hypothetical protein